jgi:hypothetical protein
MVNTLKVRINDKFQVVQLNPVCIRATQGFLTRKI